MLRVLLILLCVLLGVVVLLGVLLLALLCMRAGVELVGVSGEVALDAIYGPLRIPLWPRPRHLKRKEKKKQAEPEKKPEEAPPKGKFSLAKSGLPFGKIADVALDFLGDLTGSPSYLEAARAAHHRDRGRRKDRHPLRADRRALRHSRAVSGKHIRSARHSRSRRPGFRQGKDRMGGRTCLLHPTGHSDKNCVQAQKTAA